MEFVYGWTRGTLDGISQLASLLLMSVSITKSIKLYGFILGQRQ